MTTLHPVYRSLNKPLTIWGVDRRLFFLALFTGAGTFNFFGSLVGGLLMFGGLFGVFRSVTRTDAELLRILLSSAKFTTRYDPGKPADVTRLWRAS